MCPEASQVLCRPGQQLCRILGMGSEMGGRLFSIAQHRHPIEGMPLPLKAITSCRIGPRREVVGLDEERVRPPSSFFLGSIRRPFLHGRLESYVSCSYS